MPLDPLSQFTSMMTQQATTLVRNINQINMMVAEAAIKINPLNVINSLMQGSGSFSAKMTTTQMLNRNIFGSGGGA